MKILIDTETITSANASLQSLSDNVSITIEMRLSREDADMLMSFITKAWQEQTQNRGRR